MKEMSFEQFIKFFRERQLLIYPFILFGLAMICKKILPGGAAFFVVASLGSTYYASIKVEVKTKVDFYCGIITILVLNVWLFFLGEYFVLVFCPEESNWIVGILWVVVNIFINLIALWQLCEFKGLEGIPLVYGNIAGIVFFVYIEFLLYFGIGVIDAHNWNGGGSWNWFDSTMFFISKGIMVSNLSFESVETTKRVVESCVINGVNTVVFAGMISYLTDSFWRMFYKEK